MTAASEWVETDDIGRQLERGADVDSRIQERGERAGEPGGVELSEELSEDRHHHRDSIHHRLPGGRPVDREQEHGAADHHDRNEEPAGGLNEVAESHQHPGRQGNLARTPRQVGEKVHELGKQPERHHRDDRRGDEQDGERIDHRRACLANQTLPVFIVPAQALERFRDPPPRFGHAHHAEEQGIKRLRLARDRLRERIAALDGRRQPPDHRAERGHRKLLLKVHQRLADIDPRAHIRGELPAKRRELARANPAEEDSLPDGRPFADVEIGRRRARRARLLPRLRVGPERARLARIRIGLRPPGRSGIVERPAHRCWLLA